MPLSFRQHTLDSPVVCGNSTVFCPAGSAAPTVVSRGNYTLGGTSPAQRTTDTVCPKGRYCQNGVAVLCPAGTYGEADGLWEEGCSGACPAGEKFPAWALCGARCLATLRSPPYRPHRLTPLSVVECSVPQIERQVLCRLFHCTQFVVEANMGETPSLDLSPAVRTSLSPFPLFPRIPLSLLLRPDGFKDGIVPRVR